MTPPSFRIAALLLPALLLVRATGAEAGTDEKNLDCGGLKRAYRLHVPDSCPVDQPAPVVFVFHGGGGNGAQAERFTRFSRLADREGFIAVYPDGWEKNWNDGRNGPGISAQKRNIDDIGFVGAILDELEKSRAIDKKRVFATGPSNGGFFSNRVGAELSKRFAAIAPVIGSMAPAVAENFHPAEPVSVLIINSVADPMVPYEGGFVHGLGIKPGERGAGIPAAEVAAKWTAHNGCDVKGVVSDLPDKADDGMRVRVTRHGGGKNGAEVVFYSIEGGGHTWPGGSQYLPVAWVGGVCRDFDASEVIWEFFKKHPKP